MTKGKKWVNWTKFKTNTIMSSLKNKIKLKKEKKTFLIQRLALIKENTAHRIRISLYCIY